MQFLSKVPDCPENNGYRSIFEIFILKIGLRQEVYYSNFLVILNIGHEGRGFWLGRKMAIFRDGVASQAILKIDFKGRDFWRGSTRNRLKIIYDFRRR